MMTSTTHPKDPQGYVLLHGAGLGAWVWRDVVPDLRAPALAVDFPGRAAGEASISSLSFEEYIAHLELQVRAFPPRRIVLVAHSLSGVLAPTLMEALEGRVVGFVGVGAAVPQRGESFLSTLPVPKRILTAGLLRVFGTRPPEAAIRKGLCNDLEPQAADEIVQRFVPESRALYTTRSRFGIPDIPRSYVHLGADAEMGAPLQRRMAKRLGADLTVEIDSGHLPMLGRPGELARILDDVTTGMTPAPG